MTATPPSLVGRSPTGRGCPKSGHTMSLIGQPFVPVNGEREREKDREGGREKKEMLRTDYGVRAK